MIKLDTKGLIIKTAASMLALFALVTLFMSSSVIFDLFGIRAKEGNYVLFVGVSNFICSIIYLFATYGLIRLKPWTTRLLLISVMLLILTFIGLLLHINAGGLYEAKTVLAMLFRISISSFFAWLSWRLLRSQF